jgi:hypothetical protein
LAPTPKTVAITPADSMTQIWPLFLKKTGLKESDFQTVAGDGQTKLNASQREMITIVVNSAQILLSQITSLLDFSRAEAGRMPKQAVPFDLPAGQNQPIWVDVFIPRGFANSPPGTYTGRIKVVSSLGKVAIPFTLTVWNFELPLVPVLARLEQVGICDSFRSAIKHCQFAADDLVFGVERQGTQKQSLCVRRLSVAVIDRAGSAERGNRDPPQLGVVMDLESVSCASWFFLTRIPIGECLMVPLGLVRLALSCVDRRQGEKDAPVLDSFGNCRLQTMFRLVQLA